MKKLSWLMVLAMLISVFAFSASAEGTYTQAPMLDALVESGELPPIEERLPEVPKTVQEILPEYLDYECGNYGGTMRFITSSINWDADIFIGMNEGLLSMTSTNSGEIVANVVESYEINEDCTEFTFHLRKGLKWSDGVEVTMDDFAFTMNDFIFNTELTPSVSNFMRDGGSSTGEPFTFTVVDDSTFTISFNVPYGGFLVHIAVASWKGYTDMLKPAHYLKQFHKDYAEECHGSLEAYYEFIKPFAAVLGYDDPTEEGVWTYVFNQVDMTNWECTDPNDFITSEYFAGLIDTPFPCLYPWLLVSSVNGVMTFERNPYYFKVDPDGQQLPYADYLTSTQVEDQELVQLSIMSGECDFARESATLDNISLYRENEETAGVTAYVTPSHMNPLAYFINVNYGLNEDGTVKDDDSSKAWQEVINDDNFRKAMEVAIDAQEILDTVYMGLGEVNFRQECSGDVDRANQLLDDMGMVDIDGDGYRETPSGMQWFYQIWNGQSTTDSIKDAEFFVEFMGNIGLHVGVNPVDSALMDTSTSANEVPMRVWWNGCESLWYEADWYKGQWAPLWALWYNNGGMSGEAEVGLEPPQHVKDFYAELERLFEVDPAIGATEVFDNIATYIATQNYIITPLTNVEQCVVINSDIGNVPTGGIGIGWDYAIEEMFFNNPEEH